MGSPLGLLMANVFYVPPPRKLLLECLPPDADADFLITSNALRRPEPELQWPKLPTDNKIPFI